MRSLLLTVAAALTLSAALFAQNNDLPKRMQDAIPPAIQFKDAAVPDMLTLLGSSAGVEIRYPVTGEPGKMSNVDFKSTSVAEAFSFIVRAADLKYTVIDATTVVVTNE